MTNKQITKGSTKHTGELVEAWFTHNSLEIRQ